MEAFEQQCELIKTLAEQENVPLSENVVQYLAESPYELNSLEIKRVLVRFQSYASLMDLELTKDITDRLFREEQGFCNRQKFLLGKNYQSPLPE